MKRKMEHSTGLANSAFQFEHGQEGKMDQASTNREFVKRHFEALNRRDVQTVLGNMGPDLYDNELQGDHLNDLKDVFD